MSHIFDALQRAEDERRGAATSSRRAATELLERAEHRARIQPISESRVAATVETTLASGEAEQRGAKISLGEKAGPISEPIRTVPPEIQTLHLTRPFHDRLVAISDASSPAAEAFRLVCVRLRHMRRDRPLTSLLISSTSPEEGKSFTAANLACMLAAGSQQKVLLLDGDVRRSSQEEIFRLRAMPGLCEYLHGKRKLTESIYRLEEAGIWLLPAGHESGDSPNLLELPKLTSMAAQLSRWYDWIIIDSPPILPLADTSVWEKIADGLLLVARRGVTAKRMLKRGTEAVDQTKLTGVLLNSSNSSADKDYYYYRHTSAPSPDGSPAQ
jgi:capsular exopolysaccharide synthesis family protein